VIWVVAGIIALAAGAFLLVARRDSRPEPGVTNFRRHIDALSPEARREVKDRVRPQMRDTEPDDDFDDDDFDPDDQPER
jgi:hypothetical protein